MAAQGYAPQRKREILSRLIDSAHEDLRLLADRYAGLIEAALADGPPDAPTSAHAAES